MLWKKCLERLEEELSAQQFNTWIRPLHAVSEADRLRLLAPNRFVMDWVRERFIDRISELATQYLDRQVLVSIEVGSGTPEHKGKPVVADLMAAERPLPPARRPLQQAGRLNPDFTFESHIEGKSNQLARAAARQVGENPGGAYNPLLSTVVLA